MLAHYEGASQAPDRQRMARLSLSWSAPAIVGEYLKINSEMQEALAEAIAKPNRNRHRPGHAPVGPGRRRHRRGAGRRQAVGRRRPARSAGPLLRQALEQLATASEPPPVSSRYRLGPRASRPNGQAIAALSMTGSGACRDRPGRTGGGLSLAVVRRLAGSLECTAVKIRFSARSCVLRSSPTSAYRADAGAVSSTPPAALRIHRRGALRSAATTFQTH